MSISRRSFLKGAAAASLAVAASTVLAGCNVSGVTGGAYVSGAKTGSFTLNDGETLDVSVTKLDWVEYYNQLIPTIKVVNNDAKYTAKVDSNDSYAGNIYTIVASVKYVGVSGSTAFKVDKVEDTLKNIAAGTESTGTLLIETDADTKWTAVQLVLTLRDGGGKTVGDPIVFTFKK